MESHGFGALNWIVVSIYLLAMLGVGIWFSQRAGRSQDDYFKAGGRIPAWAAGFSIYATTLSAITFMSTPEKAYLTDWAYAAGNLAIFAIVPILIGYYIPFFRKLDVTTAYEYLEERFGPSLRVIGSLLFVLYHLGRFAIVIYLPTLALTSVTDINAMLVAAIVGILCIIYTFLGGMEGVIWSDVIQGIILLAGAATIIIWAVSITPSGIAAIGDAAGEGKFLSSENMTLSNISAALPIIFLGQVFNSLHQYTASQDVVQRYQTTPSVEATKRSLIVNGFLALLTIPLFYGMGTVLYNYYTSQGGLPDSVNTSAVVPYFIVTSLPAGIAGLLVGAIFAAAQSTVSSSLNSISACVTMDIRNRFMRGEASVTFSRVVIIIAGAFSVAVALYLVATDKSDLWDLFLAMTGLFGVPLAGVFALGIFTTRATTPGVFLGLIVGAISAYFAGTTDMGPFFVSITAFAVSMIAGYVLSIPFSSPQDRQRIEALTVRGRDKDYVKA